MCVCTNKKYQAPLQLDKAHKICLVSNKAKPIMTFNTFLKLNRHNNNNSQKCNHRLYFIFLLEARNRVAWGNV